MDNAKLNTFQKINRFLEYFWLVMVIACAAFAGWFVYREGYDEAKWYLLFPVLALAMYIMRRGLRKRFEANIQAARDAEKSGNKKSN
jgi:uncharacterized membrane protein YoaK (UPF0700 family)